MSSCVRTNCPCHWKESGTQSFCCPNCRDASPTKPEWEKEFDKEFIHPIERDKSKMRTKEQQVMGSADDVKAFISSLLFLQKAEININISQLRQWLNEDRITDPNKMVTNEQIEMWLEVEGK